MPNFSALTSVSNAPPPFSVTELLPSNGPAVQSQRGCPDKELAESISIETTSLRGKSVGGGGGGGGEDSRDSMVMEVLQLYTAQQQRLQTTLHKQKQLEKVCGEGLFLKERWLRE